MLGGAVNTLCTYGTGALFGPFERKNEHVTVGLVPDAASGVPVLGENRFEYRAPYFEHGPTMDVYPDPEAADTQSGLGVFWSSWKQQHEVKSWRGEEGYNAEAIDYALTQLSTNTSSQGSDLTTDLRANVYRFNTDGRVRVLRYFGRVDAEALAAWTGEPLPEDHGRRHRGGRRHPGRRRRRQGRPFAVQVRPPPGVSVRLRGGGTRVLGRGHRGEQRPAPARGKCRFPPVYRGQGVCAAQDLFGRRVPIRGGRGFQALPGQAVQDETRAHPGRAENRAPMARHHRRYGRVGERYRHE
jgi:hypothetical protein